MDLILVGTGFASSFFLREYLRHAPPKARVLALERGRRYAHAELVRDYFGYELMDRSAALIENRTPAKPWAFTAAFGGSSNCWWGNTPRLLPADFEMKTRYGVGADWPYGYDALEPFYAEAEAWMEISGPSDDSPFPRSGPYPQGPHRMTRVDRALKKAYPDRFFAVPTARASRPTSTGRPTCCANAVCKVCPIQAKFTIAHDFVRTWADPRVELRLDSEVRALRFENGVARGVVVREADGRETERRGDFVVLGANALFNPFLLLRSDYAHPELGVGLNEQLGVDVRVLLDGLDNFDGSTSNTAHGYLDYDGAHRAERAGALIETSNDPVLDPTPGRHRQVLELRFVFEDLRNPGSRVTVSPDGERPRVHSAGPTEYLARSANTLKDRLERWLSPLPLRRIEGMALVDTLAHAYGTTVMGRDPATSVVDADLVLHRARNVAVLGAGAFPTSSPANPTLTLCAMAIRSARRLFGATA